jgi:hypothetical protein
MKILSSAETGRWCEQNGIPWEAGRPQRPELPTRFKIPEDAQKRVHLVSARMRPFIDASVFLVSFDDWAVWPSGQRMHVFERFRLSYGETRPLIQSPGHVFEGSEIEDAISFVTLAVLFLWDCYVVTPGCGKFLFFSHDEFGLTNEVTQDSA